MSKIVKKCWNALGRTTKIKFCSSQEFPSKFISNPLGVKNWPRTGTMKLNPFEMNSARKYDELLFRVARFLQLLAYAASFTFNWMFLTCSIREKVKNIRSMSFVISWKIIFYVKNLSWTNWLHRSVPSSVSILILTFSGIISQNTSKIPENFQKSRRFWKR